MTRFGQEDEECAACGTVQTVRVLLSTYSAGSPELDTRRPGLAASAIVQAISNCESCGYASPQLNVLPEGIKAEEARRAASEYPEPSLKSRWLSWSRVLELAGDHGQAGWASLRAAWSCDDANDPAGARRCRLMAGSLFEQAEEQGQVYADDPAARVAIRVDVWRRAGDFERALETLDGVPDSASDLMAQVFDFERDLIENRDAGPYTVQDAQGIDAKEAQGPSPRRETGAPGCSLVALPLGIVIFSLTSWAPLVMLGFVMAVAATANLIWWIARKLAS